MDVTLEFVSCSRNRYSYISCSYPARRCRSVNKVDVTLEFPLIAMAAISQLPLDLQQLRRIVFALGELPAGAKAHSLALYAKCPQVKTEFLRLRVSHQVFDRIAYRHLSKRSATPYTMFEHMQGLGTTLFRRPPLSNVPSGIDYPSLQTHAEDKISPAQSIDVDLLAKATSRKTELRRVLPISQHCGIFSDRNLSN